MMESGEREISVDWAGITVLKRGLLTEKELRKLRLIVGDKGCRCPQLEGEITYSTTKLKRRRPPYLVMGRKVGQKLLVTSMYKWQKKTEVLSQSQKENCKRHTYVPDDVSYTGY